MNVCFCARLFVSLSSRTVRNAETVRHANGFPAETGNVGTESAFVNAVHVRKTDSVPAGESPDYINCSVFLARLYGRRKNHLFHGGGLQDFHHQKKVLNNIYLSFFYGAKIGIIGLNGSGKSTLMKIIAGTGQELSGRGGLFTRLHGWVIWNRNRSWDDSKTVREVVEEGCAATVALLKEYEQINQQLCEPMDDDTMAWLIERQGELYEQIDHAGGWELDSVLERAMDALRCPDPDQSVKVLSGGERRRVALCRLLLQQPDVLLLDEPTNHLDAESIDWLEQHLQQYKGTVIAVTHDRYFLDNVAGWILELDRGEGIPWKGNYSGWLDRNPSGWRWRRSRRRSAARP